MVTLRSCKLSQSAKSKLITCFLVLVTLVDLPLSTLYATSGFQTDLKQVLRVDGGKYAFANSGLDLIILAAVRFIYVSTCCAIHLYTSQHRNRFRSRSNFNWMRASTWAAPFTLIFLIAKVMTLLVYGTDPSSVGLGKNWLCISFAGTSILALFQLVLLRFSTEDFGLQCFKRKAILESEVALLESSNGEGNGTHSSTEVDQDEGKGLNTVTLKDLLSVTRPDWVLICAAFAALLVAAGAQVLIPHYTGLMIASVLGEGRSGEFRSAAIYLTIAGFVCAIFSGIRGGIFVVIGARVNVRIRQMLFHSLIQQEIGFFDTNKIGEITSRLSGDCTKVGDQVSLNVNFFLRSFVQAVGTLLFMMYLSWRLSLVAFISVPIIIGSSRVYGLYIREISKDVQQKLADANSVANQALGSMSTVRSFAAENREEKAYCFSLLEYYKLSLKEALAYALYRIISNLLPQLVTILVLFVGGRMVLAGKLDGGAVVSFMLYLTSLNEAFDNMSSIFSSVIQALGAAQKVFELIRREPMIRKPEKPILPPTIEGEIIFENVYFKYPARPDRLVLDGISISVQPGKILALVGPSGGGKSSCMALLQNFYHAEKGKIMVDNVDVEHYDHGWFHRVVSMVGQDPVLYGRSIRENIIYGLEEDINEPSHADIIEAAKLANAHDFINQLPDKYETQVGERGVQMSGGQKQRIAIARALVRKPKVLLLDEATSALDAESEFLVQEAIDNMMKKGGMTVIIIAHRLSTVKGADTIAVIQDGRVVEQGSHEALLKVGGVYKGLVSRQLAKYST